MYLVINSDHKRSSATIYIQNVGSIKLLGNGPLLCAFPVWMHVIARDYVHGESSGGLQRR